MGNQISSFGTVKCIIIGFVSFSIWKGWFNNCKRCRQTDEEMGPLLIKVINEGIYAMRSNEDECSYKIQLMQKIINVLPANSFDADQLKLDLERWKQYKRSLDIQMLDYQESCQKFLKYVNHPLGQSYAPKVIIGHPPSSHIMDNFMFDTLDQGTLEKSFWEFTNKAQEKLLEKLLQKLESAYPDVPRAKLQSTIAFVYNKYKRGIFGNELHSLEKAVGRVLQSYATGPEDFDFDDDEDDEYCNICSGKIAYDRALLECNHNFHGECLNNWLAVDLSCPVCFMLYGLASLDSLGCPYSSANWNGNGNNF